MKSTRKVRLLAAAAIAALGTASWVSPALTARAQRAAEHPLYRDPSQTIDRRVEDLLARMTLEEKVAQLVTVWEHKDRIQTADGSFSPEAASRAFPHGLGQLARPSDRRGVSANANGAAGVAAGSVGRDARETADYINAAQHWAVENSRLGIPILMHEEALH
ncbi:MAG: beta-glucosidase, partial [Alphaproteobacteria bacterium]|nr:beta-glucosidase [Alphaproteobacteria bacterium]